MRLLVLCVGLVFSGVTRAQGNASVSPQTGVIISNTDSGTSISGAAGLDAGASLGSNWSVSSGYRTFDPGGGGRRVHAASLGVGRTFATVGSGRLVVSVGAQAASPLRTGDRASYGPRLGLTLDVPVAPRWSVGIAAAATGLATDGGADEAVAPYGVLAEATAALRFYPLRSTCSAPSAWEVAAPGSLLAYERGTFRVQTPRTAAPIDVVWEFDDGPASSGEAVQRVFPKAGTHAYRAVVTHCAGTAVVEGVVDVVEPCWTPPAIDRVIQVPAVAAPGEPVEVSVVLAGTAPLSVRWRHAGRTDTTATLRFPAGLSRSTAVDVEATNCTGRVASARAIVAVDPDRTPSPIAAAFEYGRCTLDPTPVPFGVPLVDADASLNTEYVRMIGDFLLESDLHSVIIEGYADDAPATFNLDLSGWRAHTVRRLLEDELSSLYPLLGDVSSRIRTYALGTETGTECDVREPPGGCLDQRRAVVSLSKGGASSGTGGDPDPESQWSPERFADRPEQYPLWRSCPPGE